MTVIFSRGHATLHLAVSVRRKVAFLNSERFLHYCSCPTVRDWIAVYLALLCNKIEGNKAGYMANKQSLVGGQGQGKKYELAGDVFW